VLLNFLSNAIKFTEQGGVTFIVDVQGEEGAAAAGGAPARTGCFRIEDTGPGIASEHLARILEPFEQVGRLSKRGEGTGLGLTISRRIMDQMGGSLRVESELGRGTVFELTLELSSSAPVAEGDTPAWNRITGY